MLAAKQSEEVRNLISRTNAAQKQRIEQIENEARESDDAQPMSQAPQSIAPEAEEFNRKQNQAAASQADASVNSQANAANPPIEDTEAAVMRAQESIQQMRQAQAEAIVGKTPETKSKEQWAMLKQILGYGVIFLLIGGLCLLWGLFYFPAACAVAGYTQSFVATVNPTVGLDTIKRLGFDYAKILLMGLGIVIMSGIISVVLSVVFSAFDMPGVGNIPARAIGAVFGFYFAVVFSCVLGFAMFKASDRLKLPS